MISIDFNPKELDFKKVGGLMPAIIQDVDNQSVLMLGYMNEAALMQSLETGKVTFFSRTKNRLWTKGETSNHFLHLVSVQKDCDNDTLLIQARPAGAVCHTGAANCFNTESAIQKTNFLYYLEQIIHARKAEDPAVSKSYTNSLFQKGINKVAQKVGEEAVELVIEAKDNNKNLFLGEAADLLFHYLVLLAAKDIQLEEVMSVLRQRHK
jgi:phosphoribosyl-AMP cyclohydrolase / phosphoribosyl-ATP pyrophosphohydrolase